MKKLATIAVPDFIFTFYEKVGEGAGIPAEKVMADVLLRMAGELSLQALHEEGIEPEDIRRSAEERYGRLFEDEDG